MLRVLADDCPLATISRDAVAPFARVWQVRPLPSETGFSVTVWPQFVQFGEAIKKSREAASPKRRLKA